ncbi:MAG: hypothetical protein R3F34_17025 [Planctomycetota bacterium]
MTIDSLRSDHVGCYGYDRATTPFLDSSRSAARASRRASRRSRTARPRSRRT